MVINLRYLKSQDESTVPELLNVHPVQPELPQKVPVPVALAVPPT